MPIHWRKIVGPAITLSAVVLILLVDRYLFRVPNPGAITFLTVAVSAYLGGIGSGLVSAVIYIGFAAIQFSVPGELFHYTSFNLATDARAARLHSRLRHLDRWRCERASSVRLSASAPPTGNCGRCARRSINPRSASCSWIPKLRAQFINRAFRRIWRLPDEVAEGKPTFASLLSYARDANAYAIPADQINTYISDREERVRAGDERPVDIRLAERQGGTSADAKC